MSRKSALIWGQMAALFTGITFSAFMDAELWVLALSVLVVFSLVTTLWLDPIALNNEADHAE